MVPFQTGANNAAATNEAEGTCSLAPIPLDVPHHATEIVLPFMVLLTCIRTHMASARDEEAALGLPKNPVSKSNLTT
jgi:hypothetical protein